MTNTDAKGKNAFGWGILSGIIAGMIFGAFMMFVVAPALHKPIGAPLNMIGSVYLGKSLLMHPTGGSILLGFLMHMVDSAILGIIFAYIWRGIGANKGLEIVGGLIYGILVWLVMTYIALPIVGSPMAKVTGGWFVVGHLIFGLFVGLITPRYTRQRTN